MRKTEAMDPDSSGVCSTTSLQWGLPMVGLSHSSPPEIMGPLLLLLLPLETSMFSHLSLLKKFTLESRSHIICLCLTPISPPTSRIS